MDEKQPVKGAEAEIFPTTFLGRPAVIKIRSSKGYRIPELDQKIRTTRTKNEVRLMRDARRAGIRTPMIYDIDPELCTITMEEIKGRMIKDVLDRDPGSATKICCMTGKTLADLHNAGMCHGDLTTSNMILTDDGTICLIDMSMGKTRADLEDIGVDIHLLERAFSSAHPKLSDAFDELMKTYLKNKNDPKELLIKLDEIKNRGRYT